MAVLTIQKKKKINELPNIIALKLKYLIEV